MEFAYGVNGSPQWQRDIVIPQGMAFIMLISCVNYLMSKVTWNSHME
jgi:hypothetical protein